MVSVNKCLSLFFSLFFYLSLAAQTDSLKISLRDYHSSNITSVISSKLHPYFYTSDVSGKVLAYSKETLRVVATLKEASGIPIKNMRLMFDEEVLVLNQKIGFSEKQSDTLISVSIFNQKILKKIPATLDFIGNQKDVIITKSFNTDGTLNILDVYNLKFENLKRYYSSYQVDIAAYDKQNENVAYIEGLIGKQLNVVFQKKADYKNATSYKIEENHKVLALFFDDNSLNAVVFNKKEKAIEFFNLTLSQGFTDPQYSIKYNTSPFVNVDISKHNNTLNFSFSADYSIMNSPLLVSKNNNVYSGKVISTSNGISKFTHLTNSDKYVMFETFQPNFSSITPLLLYDSVTDKIVKRIPEVEQPFYYGTFLSDNNWMVIGTNKKKAISGRVSYESEVKYYEEGTFNNRFTTLGYRDYLEVIHGVIDNSNFTINRATGIKPFYGYEAKSYNDKAYYAYDIINDEVSIISKKQVGKSNVVDYCKTTNSLLVSQREYYNGGHTKPQEFSILNGQNETKLKGVYKFGKFSGNGEYLLLISGANQLRILKTSELDEIYSQTLVDGKYKIFNDEASGFIVSNSYWKIDLDKCNTASIIYEIGHDSQVKQKKTECVNVIDFASRNDHTVVSVENLGLIVDEKLHNFIPSEFPNRVSFNKDGSRLMAGFNNGIIRIFNTDDMSLLAETIHPDYKSHVFIDNLGNYFSNVNPHDYITAVKNGKSIKINDLENQLFNPDKLLEIFGKPDEDYLTILNKALSLKKSDKYKTANVPIKLKKDRSKTKGDLYVLAIGVSEYQQSNFNLTYADKDAIDMTKIYGKLPDEDIKTYKTKYFGNRYICYDQDNNIKGQINKYIENYNTVSHLEPVSVDGRYWLENDRNAHYLWDFNLEKRQLISLPETYEMDAYGVSKSTYSSPDNDGFYLVSDSNVFYFFEFESMNFTQLVMPDFLSSDYIDQAEISFLMNGKWAINDVLFKGLDTDIVVKSGYVNSKKIDSIYFTPDVVRDINNNAKVDTISTYSVKVKAISANGQHLLYKVADNELYYKNLSNNTLPMKLPITYSKNLTDFSISEDANYISVIRNSNDGEDKVIENYNLDGILISENNFTGTTIGLNSRVNHFNYIRQSKPMVQESVLEDDNLLSQNNPESFNNTFVKCITNKKATSDYISNTLKTFFTNAKPEDQIVVFIAGHGVLDEDLNYYFAPHDMDFNSVKDRGVAFNDFIESLKQSNAEQKLLLMDSCHSGNTLDIDKKTVATVEVSNSPGKRGSSAQSISKTSNFKISQVISDLFNDFLSQSGVTVISASSGADVAYENESIGNGAFTSAYITYLKKRLKGSGFSLTKESLKTSLDIVEDDVSELLKAVMLLTNGKQTPDLREFNTASKLKMW